jgi:hypothetical protein
MAFFAEEQYPAAIQMYGTKPANFNPAQPKKIEPIFPIEMGVGK